MAAITEERGREGFISPKLRDAGVIVGVLLMLGFYGWGWAEQNRIARYNLAGALQSCQGELRAEKAKSGKPEAAK